MSSYIHEVFLIHSQIDVIYTDLVKTFDYSNLIKVLLIKASSVGFAGDPLLSWLLCLILLTESKGYRFVLFPLHLVLWCHHYYVPYSVNSAISVLYIILICSYLLMIWSFCALSPRITVRYFKIDRSRLFTWGDTLGLRLKIKHL